MKKSMIALATLATLSAAGTAAAQSSVTLYGRMDASLGSERVNDVSTTKLFSGNLTTSRLGFRGSEDLCIDPVNSCSGVNVEGNDDEHPDGRRHQALDGQA